MSNSCIEQGRKGERKCLELGCLQEREDKLPYSAFGLVYRYVHSMKAKSRTRESDFLCCCENIHVAYCTRVHVLSLQQANTSLPRLQLSGTLRYPGRVLVGLFFF